MYSHLQTATMAAGFRLCLWIVLVSVVQYGYCQYRLLDLKTAACSMSSTYTNPSSPGSNSLNCTGALNGNISTTYKVVAYPDANCISTTNRDSAPYWQVDLGQTYTIHRIIIYPELKYPEAMTNIRVLVDDVQVYQFPSDKDKISDTVPVYITNVTRAHVIRLQGDSRKYLEVCEVQVEVLCSPGCQSACGNNGNCACKAGWIGAQCEACDSGFYRLVDSCVACGKGCDPPNTCKANGVCRCKPGWKPGYCKDHCESGTYGQDCRERCSVGCSPDVCSVFDGTCQQCKQGYTGDKCDDCVDGYYKDRDSCTACSTNCADTCNTNSGHCTCKPGWQPPLCNAQCSSGRYGQNCSYTCSSGCESMTCHHVRGTCQCRTGWTGAKCTECSSGYYKKYGGVCVLCGDGCQDTCVATTGHCTCNPGWQPPLCQDPCVKGTYGQNCEQKCSAGCQNTACNASTGMCDCREGWTGPRCEDCARGYYKNTTSGQVACQKCGTGCSTTECDDVTGNCACRPDWQPSKCAECVPGKFGDDCQHTCSVGCNSKCDTTTGTCTCKQGYEGPTCDNCISGYYISSGFCKPCGKGCRYTYTCDLQTGRCPCKPGWTPPLCQEECKTGTYGQDCSLSCGRGCDGGCDSVRGNCSCKPHWKTPGCTDCEPGYWGREDNCQFQCGAGCEDRRACDTRTGQCTCTRGNWQTPNCTVCVGGYWGGNCTELCGSCASKSCGQERGLCDAQGCAEGYTGPGCKEEVESNVGAIVGLVVSVILIIVVIIVIVLMVRRRRAVKGRRRLRQEAARDGNPDLCDRRQGGDADDIGGHIYRNVPSPAATNGTAQNAQKGTARNAPQKPPRGPQNPTGREAVYENVACQPRPGQPSATASQSAAAATRPDKPKERPKIPEPSSAVVVDDDDDDYNSEAIYTSTKEMTSQHFDSFQQYLIKCLGSGKLAAQFAKLPKGMKHPHEVGMTEENKRKNRFRALCAYDYNRVILTKPAGDKSSDYINATHIKGADGNDKKYIATQGPKDNTVDDLWWMVWQEGVTQIIMLTNLKEEGKDKCEEYWPAPGSTKTYGHVIVRGLEEQERADFVIRPFTIKTRQSPYPRHVSQYHYRAWPDHGVPQAASLVDFWRYVKGRSNPAVPLLVHCSAGVGRTGTFIALDIAFDLESRGQSVNVNSLVTRLREERCLMVQSEGQYKFVHEVILEAHTSRESRLPTSQLEIVFPTGIRTDKNNPRIDKEFQMLREMGQFAPKPKHTMATLPENMDKNRNKDALPDDSQIVYLRAHVRGRNQYINAVYLSSFHRHHGFILTQLPLQDTVVDFWRLVDGNEVSTIVSLGSDEEEQPGKDYCQFWPRMVKDVVTAIPYTVTLTVAASTAEDLTTYKLTLKTSSNPTGRKVEMLHYRNWAGEVPGDVTSVIQLVDKVKAIHSEGRSQVIVQCTDGAAKSGLFCALYDVISRVTYDNEVDVYLTARQIQRVRPQAISTQLNNYMKCGHMNLCFISVVHGVYLSAAVFLESVIQEDIRRVVDCVHMFFPKTDTSTDPILSMAQYRFLYQAAQEYSRHLGVYQNADVGR